VDFQVIAKQRDGWVDQSNPKTRIENPKFDGTVKRGAATCYYCGYTTHVARVREQLKAHQGGTQNPTLFCIVASEKYAGETIYRAPRDKDLHASRQATQELAARSARNEEQLSLVPDEYLPIMSGVFNAPIYGHSTWGSLFTARQALMLSTYGRLVRELRLDGVEEGLAIATRVLLAFTVSKLASFSSSLCIWRNVRSCVAQTFGRQALPMVWDFGEMNPFAGSAGDFSEAVEYLLRLVDHVGKTVRETGHCEQADAAASPLPSDSAALLATDPPYYNAVPYADLSDFFYVWLKRMLYRILPQNFTTTLTPKPQEICEMSGWDPDRYPEKDGAWFEKRMSESMVEGRRVAAPDSVGVVVFAHKSTSGWEAQLQAMIQAGWVITGSWPIDTERSVGFERTILRFLLHPFISSAARVRIPTARCVPTKSAIGATCCRSCPAASTNGCRA
jgi:putative DNA methylase